jgi:ribosomal protein S18 acetylase RimI-like enzyme
LKSNSPKSLDELAPDEVVRECEQNYIDYWKCSAQSPGPEFSESGGIVRCITGLPQDIFNVILCCRLSHRDMDQRIDEMIDHLRTRRVTAIWHVGLLTEPKDLGSRLESRGFAHDYDLTAMASDLERIDPVVDLPDGVAVRTVSGREESSEWVKCLAESWESPPEVVAWMHRNACFNTVIERDSGHVLPRKMFLGLIDGTPVGASMLFWSGDIAGLQAVGTAHSGRGKGVGTAVVGAALNHARSLGFKHVVVLSTVEGVKMYQKAGFRTFGKLPEHSMDFRRPR